MLKPGKPRKPAPSPSPSIFNPKPAQQIILIWDFPKTRGTLFWGPYNKDPTI